MKEKRHKTLYRMSGSIYRKFKTRQNQSDRNQMSGCQGLGMGKRLQRATGDLSRKGTVVLYFDDSGGYTTMHICQNASHCTVKIGGFACM